MGILFILCCSDELTPDTCPDPHLFQNGQDSREPLYPVQHLDPSFLFLDPGLETARGRKHQSIITIVNGTTIGIV